MTIRITFIFITAGSIFFISDINAQTIRGQIFDYDTKEVVLFANIYFSSTMHGTTSDHNGLFELSTDGYSGQDIVISSVGYDSWIIEDFQDNKFYKIYLKQSAKLLREIIVLPNDLPREKKEKMFLQDFLGTTKNASNCYIENLDDVILTFFKSTKTLEANCFEPLVIYNERLGYRIKYYLDSFKSDPDNIFYQGNFLFEEIESSDQVKKRKIVRRREKAYYGSRMHFFRVLWNGDEGNTDYYLQTLYSEQLGIDSLVSDEIDNLKCLFPYDRIKINYKNDISLVKFRTKECIPFNQSGFFDSKGLFWTGNMAQQRIGDLLPYEYWPFK